MRAIPRHVAELAAQFVELFDCGVFVIGTMFIRLGGPIGSC